MIATETSRALYLSAINDTIKRRYKPNAIFFREIIHPNGSNQSILWKYLKEMPSLTK